MIKISKQKYTTELKDLSVKRVKSGQSISAVAKELGVIEQTLRNWVKATLGGAVQAFVIPARPLLQQIQPPIRQLSGFAGSRRSCP